MGAMFNQEATIINSSEISQGYAYLGGYVYLGLQSTFEQNNLLQLFIYQFQAATRAQKEPPKKKNDWRKKREEFVNALRAAKAAQRHLAAGGKISDLPPPPPSDTSDYIQCPHCNRKFNESVAERHIPKCKDIKSNKRR